MQNYYKLIHESSFSTQEGGWETYNTSDVTSSLEDGRYNIVVKKSPYLWTQSERSAFVVDNFRLSVTAQFNPTSSRSSQCGVFFRHDQGTEYGFYITRGGYYGLFVKTDFPWYPIVNWHVSSCINPIGNNRIVVEAQDDLIVIKVNGGELIRVRDNTTNTGYVGLCAGNPLSSTWLEVQFTKYLLEYNPVIALPRRLAGPCEGYNSVTRSTCRQMAKYYAYGPTLGDWGLENMKMARFCVEHLPRCRYCKAVIASNRGCTCEEAIEEECRREMCEADQNAMDDFYDMFPDDDALRAYLDD